MTERHHNRHRALTARKTGTAWCNTCDRALVGNWGKCSVCGARRNIKKKRGFTGKLPDE